jgi:uncharacterized protein with von Willebrand factor type A (vWA) domain
MAETEQQIDLGAEMDDGFDVARVDGARTAAIKAGKALVEEMFPGDPNRVFDLNRWERTMWGELARDGAGDKFVPGSDHKAGLPGVDAFPREMFGRLYGQPPRRDGVLDEDTWADRAHDIASDLREFKELEDLVRGDPYLAGMSALTIANEVMKEVPEPQEKPDNPQDLQDAAEGLEGIQGQGGGDGGQGAQDMADKLKEQAQQARESLKEMGQQMDGDAVRRTIRKAAAQAQEQAEEINDAASGAGWGTGPGQKQPTDPRAKIKLAKRMRSDKKFAKLMELVGRLTRIAAQKQKVKSKRSRSMITGIELGGDLQHVVPAEIMVAGMCPATKTRFARRLANKQCVSRRWDGKEKAGKGPVVMLVDDSGSMGAQDMAGGLSREIVAKAVAFAVASVCRKQKRDLHVIMFSHRLGREWIFPKGQIDWTQLNEMASYHESGGTDWHPPIERAVEITTKGTWKEADVLMISDGDCRFSSATVELLEKARKRDVDLRGVLVSGSGYDLENLQRGCSRPENAVRVTDLMDEKAHDVMFSF